MKKTTLCYLIKQDQILMMHRNKKTRDPNQDKWIGIGGHVEIGESILDACMREVKEETGFDLQNYTYHGVIWFHSDQYETEEMHLFSSNEFKGTLSTSNEGTLAWINIHELFTLNLWEGDHIFLRHMLEGSPFFHLSLTYQKDQLIHHHMEWNKDIK